jgi:hypothetical protein
MWRADEPSKRWRVILAHLNEFPRGTGKANKMRSLRAFSSRVDRDLRRGHASGFATRGKRIAIAALFACAAGLVPAGASAAGACTAQDFGAVVDQTAQALRDLNINGANRFQAKLRSLKEKHGLTEDEIQTRAAALQDDKMSEFNREIDALVNQMDALSQTPNDKINCEKLDELKRVRDRLLTIMGQKSGYMLAKADIELDKAGGGAPSSSPRPRADTAITTPESSAPGTARTPPKSDRLDQKPADTADKAPALPPVTPKKDAPPKTADAPTPKVAPTLPERRSEPARTARNWTPESQTFAPTPPNLLKPDRRDDTAPPVALTPPPDGQLQLPPPGQGGGDTTYSIAEIQEAGRGIFGTITAQFAGAINYAFQNFGQPNAYITGSEGGAAILAGLRYGKGLLHLKTAPPSDIYWQGPSVGYDLGAEGSNALFLVYNLDDPYRIYGRFTGIGGAAYVAGGVGLNVLGKGNMVMVPIRSGVGLRLGANLAYLKFTERQTWNPF